MPVLTTWDLPLDVDSVLLGQGRDPELVRSRNPQLLDISSRAYKIGLSSIQPQFTFNQFTITSIQEDQIRLEKGIIIDGKLPTTLFKNAGILIAGILTIGDALEKLVDEWIAKDESVALALDGLGSFAVEALISEICAYFDHLFRKQGLFVSLPINPGLDGWELHKGQQEIFSIVDGSEIGVTINSYSMLIPKKSSTIALGVGLNPFADVNVCDLCGLKSSCRYRGKHA
jgi:hypothetical protein